MQRPTSSGAFSYQSLIAIFNLVVLIFLLTHFFQNSTCKTKNRKLPKVTKYLDMSVKDSVSELSIMFQCVYFHYFTLLCMLKTFAPVVTAPFRGIPCAHFSLIPQSNAVF